jgi:predicted lipoprotein
LVKLTDFKTTAEFNKISESLNTIIREKAIPDEIKTVKVGDTIDLVGAVKLGEKQQDLLNLSVLPIKISKI